jgi:hypothetical protein
MSFNLLETAKQIDVMATNISGRQNEHLEKIKKSIDATNRFSIKKFEQLKHEKSSELSFLVPTIFEHPKNRYQNTTKINEYCVMAVDGSQIEMDRHAPTTCFLINIGTSTLEYGYPSKSILSSKPILYARNDELVVKNELNYSERLIEGDLLAAKRSVDEIKFLRNLLEQSSPTLPRICLLDGSLQMISLRGYYNDEIVLHEFIESGMVTELNKLKSIIANSNDTVIASYISYPNATDIINALKLTTCQSESIKCGRFGNEQACTECIGGVLDRELFHTILSPGERSSVFYASENTLSEYYEDHRIMFFYINVNDEIARIEIPEWIGKNKERLELLHSLILDQCSKGRGYPISLMEAHEQAVITNSDRKTFMTMIEKTLHHQKIPVSTSMKNHSKNLRWL